MLLPLDIPVFTTRPQFNKVINALGPRAWWKWNEVSDTTVINYGSNPSANLTWTPGSGPPVGALGQDGPFGANSAYSFNGVDSLAVAANNANNIALIGMKVRTRCFLVYPRSAGESNNGRLWDAGGGSHFLRINSAGAATLRSAHTGTGNANTVTTTGLILDTWQWIFDTFDNTGDRLINLYYGIPGVVSEYEYSTHTAMTGTFTEAASGAFNIGSVNNGSATLDALVAQAIWFDKILTPTEMLQVNRATFPT